MEDEVPRRREGTKIWAPSCDTCHLPPSTVYCIFDSTYLCAACDARVHGASPAASTHKRLLVCQACERAPAAFLCKADAASLCAACDADVHSANPLASRHHRVPILPFSGPPAADSGRWVMGPTEGVESKTEEEEDDEAASWLLLNPVKSSSNHQFLDLVGHNSGVDDQFSPQKSCRGDRVVPVECGQVKDHLQHHQRRPIFRRGMDYEASMSHSISISSLDVSVVPESLTSDMSISHLRPTEGTIDPVLGSPAQVPTQLNPKDREARVMRYREKKKTRKFEKTIRYASRKAYAETRPRIKGRFAKRADIEVEANRVFVNGFMTQGAYGIVPSF
ncbi:hypothetical protein Nepgr_020854 [Nepenthes gracilis]|uniref:Uncharacterized protein n=1 Tax=Nepenthes gracilis TaxID=150966 RepID=A0AAD3SWY9_NEPGR|nr:hypothetical protein Nepgr_020854 [Nepenthes gracilis]